MNVLISLGDSPEEICAVKEEGKVERSKSQYSCVCMSGTGLVGFFFFDLG